MEMNSRTPEFQSPQPFVAAGGLSKSDLVKAVFERPQRYLTRRRFDITIRAETVRDFVSDKNYQNVLDIGCGDASISLPLLKRDTKLTLLDFSTSMLSIAQSKVPNELAGNVTVRNEDLMDAAFHSGTFDVIICLGVLAHVESPEVLIQKLATLLRPGGSLILEFTDAFHSVGRLSRMVRRLTEFAAPARSPVNLLSYSRVSKLLGRHGLRLESRFRYAFPPLFGFHRFLPQSLLYNIVRLMFGTCGHNRNSRLGNEYVCLLTRDAAGSQN